MNTIIYYVTECLDYKEYIESTYQHLLQNDQSFEQCLDINWIKRNTSKINHIYMYASLAQKKCNNETIN